MKALALLVAILILPLGAEAQTCSAFSTCEEAMESLQKGNASLDRDNDGIPCESICGGGSGDSGSESRSGSGSVGEGAPGDPPASTSQGCRILSSYDARRVAKGERVDLSGNGCQIIFNPESKTGDRPSVFRRRSQAFSGGGRAPKQGQSATLVSVGDGDTIRVRTSSGRNQTIRLACIDAPEMAQGATGRAAREALASMVQIGPLQIKPQTTDRYGRSVAEVFVGGRNVNLELVRGGFAFAYRKYLAQCDQAAYLGAEAWAQQAGQGVWRYGTEKPWDYRQRRRESR